MRGSGVTAQENGYLRRDSCRYPIPIQNRLKRELFIAVLSVKQERGAGSFKAHEGHVPAFNFGSCSGKAKSDPAVGVRVTRYFASPL